jgi:uncharacterized membrane protein
VRSDGGLHREYGYGVMVFGLDSVRLFGVAIVVAVVLTAAAFTAGRQVRRRDSTEAVDARESRRMTAVVVRWSGTLFVIALAAWALLDGGDLSVVTAICAAYVVGQAIALVIVHRRYRRE